MSFLEFLLEMRALELQRQIILAQMNAPALFPTTIQQNRDLLRAYDDAIRAQNEQVWRQLQKPPEPRVVVRKLPPLPPKLIASIELVSRTLQQVYDVYRRYLWYRNYTRDFCEELSERPVGSTPEDSPIVDNYLAILNSVIADFKACNKADQLQPSELQLRKCLSKLTKRLAAFRRQDDLVKKTLMRLCGDGLDPAARVDANAQCPDGSRAPQHLIDWRLDNETVENKRIYCTALLKRQDWALDDELPLNGFRVWHVDDGFIGVGQAVSLAPVPYTPEQTSVVRQAVGLIASTIGQMVGQMAKASTDQLLLQQTINASEPREQNIGLYAALAPVESDRSRRQFAKSLSGQVRSDIDELNRALASGKLEQTALVRRNRIRQSEYEEVMREAAHFQGVRTLAAANTKYSALSPACLSVEQSSVADSYGECTLDRSGAVASKQHC